MGLLLRRRNRNNRREEAPCREGCPQLAVAPPWSAVGGAFTATDLVRHHAMQDNMASGNYGNSGGSECNESYAAAKEAYMSLMCLSVSKPVLGIGCCSVRGL